VAHLNRARQEIDNEILASQLKLDELVAKRKKMDDFTGIN
jgi:hypothetical protein